MGSSVLINDRWYKTAPSGRFRFASPVTIATSVNGASLLGDSAWAVSGYPDMRSFRGPPRFNGYPTCRSIRPLQSGRRINRASSPTMPRRKAKTTTTKMAP